MSDKFAITPLDQLLQIILNQLDHGKLFGVPAELFFHPHHTDSFRTSRYNQLLETPIGVAAGPHTQLAQNIIAAWLTGARYIELKTVQTLDELEISKPCIDMQDEGYNCEWSQELKVNESFDQYLDAWIIIHILKHKYNWGDPKEPGVIFNMSVGYDYTGIQSENVQWFLDKMTDASDEIIKKLADIKSVYPEVVLLDINPCISNNITLSTMHGCPVDEIEKIGGYFIAERKLHTTIKLNPTLLGRESLNNILQNSGFKTRVPDEAFEHDPEFEDGVHIIKNLRTVAATNKVHFGIKLTNTLESINHKDVFPQKESMMYLSGRALHPISVSLANKLQKEFDGKLDISFSGGIDVLNINDVILSGLYPATVCTDLLKPGGYGRLRQYIDELRTVPVFYNKNKEADYLNDYTGKVLRDNRYKKTVIHDPDIKTNRPLGYFDCIHAPCVDTCPTHQEIPDYLYQTSEKEYDKALNVVLRTNPFPRMTGMVCDHLCQTKCTRINYDSPVLIREVKRFLAEKGKEAEPVFPKNINKKVAVIGAGPSGLSCAYFLAKAGFEVNIYESKARAGGMVSGAIPAFRLTDEAIATDIEQIEKMGVKIKYNYKIDKSVFENIRQEHDFIYIATGAQSSIGLKIENNNSNGVLDPLRFLFNAKENKSTGIGKHVVIIGGGNTAMDAARTAYRLVGKNGTVTIIYRRTIKQMPADMGEIKAVLEEGINIMELAVPLKLSVPANLVAGKPKNEQTQLSNDLPATEVAGTGHSLTCIKMKLSGVDSSGRPKPVPIPGSDFIVHCDTIIPAIGQKLDIDFIDTDKLTTKPGSYETLIENVFIGGDAMRGASTAINAIGDGRKVAGAIINKANLKITTAKIHGRQALDLNTHMINRSIRINPVQVTETPLTDRKNFNLVTRTLSEDEAIHEASRCLLCDEVCSICTTVCPNLALYTYETKPGTYYPQKIKFQKGGYQIIEGKPYEILQQYQILHIADWCNECGNCTTFCPTSGAPFKNKPHLYLNKRSFDEDKDGYYMNISSDYDIIYFKKGSYHSTLARLDDHFLYKSDNIVVKLDLDSFEVMDLSTVKKDNFEIDLREPVEMYLIIEGARSFLK